MIKETGCFEVFFFSSLPPCPNNNDTIPKTEKSNKDFNALSKKDAYLKKGDTM
jgi:hypothetical protein